ncbi:MAG: hypothetical protein AB1330_02865 [Bacillota bacterium]
MRDTVYSGTIAGTLGAPVKLAVNLLFYVASVAKTTTLHLSAAALLPKGVALNTPAASLTIGVAVCWLVSALSGIIGVYILRLTGRDFLWLKGIIYGGLIWVVGYGYLATLVVPERLLRPDLATSVAMLTAHLAFGLTVLFAAGSHKIEVL